ncbi:hypothetical protein [Micromonospora sp. 4G55]|uniref:hypothetical protein n=1 Tax=Micromonospora sp. 4G55 TaxID=2806102 RepID=UPI001A47B372|nr:hypothetical protein [Micromonospora sp. 4G55]MBM0257393.1 hypothetical protein [Micromonospora sp. 4G55]
MTRSGPDQRGWSPMPVRHHRRPSGTLLGLLGVGSILCCLPVALGVPIRLASHEVARRVGVVPMLVLLFAALWAGGVAYRRWREWTHRRVLRWGEGAGWSPVIGRTIWPWTSGQFRPDRVRVAYALTRDLGGYPVTVGEVAWTHDGLAGADRVEGRGHFAILRLPRPYPTTAVQRRRTIAAARAGEDEFVRRYRIILRDTDLADRLVAPALHAAHVTGLVPPWTVIGDELYTVVTDRRPLTPRRVAQRVDELLRIADLLGLGERA